MPRGGVVGRPCPRSSSARDEPFPAGLMLVGEVHDAAWRSRRPALPAVVVRKGRTFPRRSPTLAGEVRDAV